MRNSAEAVIIGGGVNGCSICYHLAERGVKAPILVERSSLGAGSTGRSSGVSTGFSLLLFTQQSAFSDTIPRLAKVGQDILRNFEEIIGVDAGYKETGVLFLGGKEVEEPVEASFALIRDLGFEGGTIGREEAKEFAPYLELDDIDCIGLEPHAGYADPPAVAQGYASAAGRLGAEIVLGNAVLDVEIEGGRVRGVVTEQGRIATDTAIVVGGPWGGQLMATLGFPVPFRPTRHEVFFLKRGPGAPSGHAVVFDLPSLTYFRQESPDLTLVGDVEHDDTAEPDNFEQGTDMSLTRSTWQKVAHRMPSLADAELFTSYAGMYTETPDGYPVIDRVGGVEGLYLVGAFNGYGFKISPAVGIVVAEMVTEGESRTVDVSSLGVGRFGGRGLGEGWP